MDALEFTQSSAVIRLKNEEIYVILQCIEEALDKMSENDIQTIMNSTSANIKGLADEVMALLNDMKDCAKKR
jgi:spore coat polysaccharide biosynthesis protein SpsF (cytidylyltransferase family)